MEKLGQNNIYSQFLGQYPILRTYKGTDLINEYKPLYTPPVDWSDIRTDCPENSIALYAGHTADYSQYDNLGFTATMSATDLTTVGSPTISSGVVSGFSSGNYLETTGYAPSRDISNYEFGIGIIVPELGIAKWILGYRTNTKREGFILSPSGQLCVLFSRVTGTTTDFGIISSLSISQGDTVIAVAGYRGNNTWFLKASKDNGATWVEDTATCEPNTLGTVDTRRFTFGKSDVPSYESPFEGGSIDLNNTYIKVNGAYFLMPYGSQNGYKVYIDETLYGTYNSGSTCNITWSTSGITTGDDITTPTALKAHKIWIEPATEGNNITAFHCNRVAASGTEEQGVLWAHFNLTNAIKIVTAFGSTSYENLLMKALTAKNNLVVYTVASTASQSGFYMSFYHCESLEYLPVLKAENQTYSSGVYIPFHRVSAKKVVIKNNNGGETTALINSSKVEEFVVENGLTLGSSTSNQGDAHGATKLKKFPKINDNKAENFQMYNCPALEPVNIDDRFNDTRKLFRFYGTQSIPTPALKSLRVSNEAPFDGADPQINVNYTGMDRTALVQLFEDLPYNVGYEIEGSPTIQDGVLSNTDGSNYLQTDAIFPNSYNSFEISCEFTMPSSLTDMFAIERLIMAGSRDGVDLNYNSGNAILYCYYKTSDGNSQRALPIYSVSLQPSQTYVGKFIWTGTKYISQIWQNGVKLGENSTELDIPLYKITVPFYIGGTPNADDRYFHGSINLNSDNTYIKVNDVYWFRGQPAMTKTLSCFGATGNQDKLTIVGSPTISNGIVSGFSDASYIETSKTVPVSNDIVYVTRFKATDSSPNVQPLIRADGGRTVINWYSPDGKLRFIGYDTEDVYFNAAGSTSLSLNVYYYIKFVVSGTIGTVSFSTDGINYTTEITHSFSSNTSSSVIFGSNAPRYLLGSIDLNNTYIKINNELWFGREQYLLPEDKAIAEDKGWALTLVAS